MTAYTLYWAPKTVDRYRKRGDEGDLVGAALSGQFLLRRVVRGDRIYPVHVRDGRLGIVCRLTVEAVELNSEPDVDDPSTWTERAVAVPASGTSKRFERLLSVHDTDRVRFESSAAPVLLTKAGRVNPQCLQTMRELTRETIDLLDSYIDAGP